MNFYSRFFLNNTTNYIFGVSVVGDFDDRSRSGQLTSSGLSMLSLYMLIRTKAFLAKYSGVHTILSLVSFESSSS